MTKSLQDRLAAHRWPRLALQFHFNSMWDNKAEGSVDAWDMLAQAHLYDLVVHDNELLANPKAQPFLGPNGSLRQKNPNLVTLAYWNLPETPKLPNEPQYVNARSVYSTFVEADYLHRPDGVRVKLNDGAGDCINLLKPSVRDRIVDGLAAVYGTDLVDGIFFDRVTSISYIGPIDSNDDGVADVPAEFDAAWIEASAEIFHRLRERLPDKLLFGNGGWNAPLTHASWLNGIMVEQFLEGEAYPKFNLQTILSNLVGWQGSSVKPTLNILMGNRDVPNTPDACQFFQFLTAMSCLTDSYACPTNRSGSYAPTSAWRQDEFFVNAAGRSCEASPTTKGWLGRPVGPAQILHNSNAVPPVSLEMLLSQGWQSVNGLVFTRLFTRGAVLVNLAGTSVSVTLPRYWPAMRRILGVNSANNGAVMPTPGSTGGFTLPGRSGICLQTI